VTQKVAAFSIKGRKQSFVTNTISICGAAPFGTHCFYVELLLSLLLNPSHELSIGFFNDELLPLSILKRSSWGPFLAPAAGAPCSGAPVSSPSCSPHTYAEYTQADMSLDGHPEVDSGSFNSIKGSVLLFWAWFLRRLDGKAHPLILE
jgi:hypothetical protein